MESLKELLTKTYYAGSGPISFTVTLMGPGQKKVRTDTGTACQLSIVGHDNLSKTGEIIVDLNLVSKFDEAFMQALKSLSKGEYKDFGAPENKGRVFTDKDGKRYRIVEEEED